MKLKTLKDFDNNCILREEKCCVPDFIKELKVEAIKWVKQYTIWAKTSPQDNLMVISFIKKFFNITEEDLE